MTEDLIQLKHHLDHITKEVTEVKKMIIGLDVEDKEKTEKAWKDLVLASREISKLWQGSGAVEEIKSQREKR